MVGNQNGIKLKTVIVNHNCNKNAILLKKKFSLFSEALLIDSGSDIEESEIVYFDFRLDNVYYNGLLNKTYEILSDDYSHLLFITSDVTVHDCEGLISRIHEVYQKDIGVYAPSAKHSTHSQMNNHETLGLRKVTFTEGFCFVTPKTFLNQICPIDLSLNKIGHGVDIYFGYLSMVNKKFAVVDDKIIVNHPHGSGYNDKEARVQRDNWFRTKSKQARLFHYLASLDFLKNAFGFYLILFLMNFVSVKKVENL